MENTFYIETFGCSANQNSSEIMAGLLVSNGFMQVRNSEMADIIILNTCVVKEKTESKIKRRIQDLKEFASKKLLIVAGCMAQTDMKKVRNLNKNAVFLGTFHIKDIVGLIKDFREKKLNEVKQISYISNENEVKLCLPKIPTNSLISIQQISEGCLGNCAFCKTRLAKGKLFSYPIDKIVKSIESDLTTGGAKEVWITCQDCASYGMDWQGGKSKIVELLEKILVLKHKFKLRLGMMDINNLIPISNRLFEVYSNKKMYKFIHIPVQSASNDVLKNMNRFYKIEEAQKIIDRFRTEFKDGVIATDLIVGYPTETDNDHEKNLEFLRKNKFEVLNLSKFSSHKGTAAGKLKILSNNVVHKRTSELMEEHRKFAKESKEKYMGKELTVFVNKRVENAESLCEARDENYNIILVKCGKENLGKEIKVRINEIGVHHMIGEVLENNA